MFNSHNPYCRMVGRRDIAGHNRVLAFVLASIREKTDKLPDIMNQYKQQGFKYSRISWGNKAKAGEYIVHHEKELFDGMRAILPKESSDHQLMMHYLNIPGFGIPKSGFIVQLLTGKAGCLDVHNIRRYLPDIDASRGTPSMFQTAGNSEKLKARKVASYLNLCDEIGGARFLWDNWCNSIAEMYPDKFSSGFEVSKLHMDCLR